MRIFMACLAFLSLMLAPPAYGQIDDILDDIFGGGQHHPFPQSPRAGEGLIENIPVGVQLPRGQSLDDHIIIVSAYAPPPPNVRQAKPRLIGQTRLLLTGLSEQLELVVAVPEPVTRDLSAARISAEVRGPADQAVLIARQDDYYKGFGAARLELIPVGGSGNNQTHTPIAGYESVRGTVGFDRQQGQVFRGGTVTVKLMEAGVPAGNVPQILAEIEIDIDQKSAPFKFILEYPVRPRHTQYPLELVAELKDWAGRITHTNLGPVPYRGPNELYDVVLGDANISAPVSPMPTTPLTKVSGEARFDAYKGLPRGSVMYVTLKQKQGSTEQIIGSQSTALDGLSGNVKFDVTPNQTIYQGSPNSPNGPMLNIQISDGSGKVFFSGPDVPVSAGYNRVQLLPTPNY